MERWAVVWARTGDVHEMAQEPVALTDEEPALERQPPFLYYWDGTMWKGTPHEARLYGSPDRARQVAKGMGSRFIAVRTVIDGRSAATQGGLRCL